MCVRYGADTHKSVLTTHTHILNTRHRNKQAAGKQEGHADNLSISADTHVPSNFDSCGLMSQRDRGIQGTET